MASKVCFWFSGNWIEIYEACDAILSESNEQAIRAGTKKSGIKLQLSVHNHHKVDVSMVKSIAELGRLVLPSMRNWT